MTFKLLSASILAVAALASGSSFAQDSRNFPEVTPVTSAATRGDVRAELAQAEGKGYTTRIANDAYPQTEQSHASEKSRAQVRAEAGPNVDKTAIYH